jgi:hypothetical protein
MNRLCCCAFTSLLLESPLAVLLAVFQALFERQVIRGTQGQSASTQIVYTRLHISVRLRDAPALAQAPRPRLDGCAS